jgi:hypothetical protein
MSEKATITEHLKSNMKFYSCTSDGWSSLARDPYVSLTVHYIDNDWKLQTKCLATMYLPENHTGGNISNFVTDTLAEYNLYRENLVTMTTGSAANMKSACSKLGVQRLSCFGHILHNAISNTLNGDDEVKNLSIAVRRIVSVFSYSFNFKRKLQKLQKDMGLPENKLINDVATRWGSKLKMFKSVAVQMEGIERLFTSGKLMNLWLY